MDIYETWLEYVTTKMRKNVDRGLVEGDARRDLKRTGKYRGHKVTTEL